MNAIDILKHAAVEYPKHPTTGGLLHLLSTGPSEEDRDLSEDNLCMCLLGQIGISGGLKPSALIDGWDSLDQPRGNYAALEDGSGIEEAIQLLATAIRNTAGDFNAPTARFIVYQFNDQVIGVVPKPHQVQQIVDKIHEAIALGESREAAANAKN